MVLLQKDGKIKEELKIIRSNLVYQFDPNEDNYDDYKDKQSRRAANRAKIGRDIGKIPPPKNLQRRLDGSGDFRFFCNTYFPDVFPIPWSKDHLKVIDKIERAVLTGALFAMAMPRGSGKTSLCEVACKWALIYGHRKFIALIGSDKPAVLEILDSIKTEFEINEKLYEDFPEVCKPIRALEGIAHRANGQLCEGRRTSIGWSASECILPTIEGSISSGAVIKVKGITARIRGMKYKTHDGENVRPDLVIIDDPQTDESAKSLTQVDARMRVLNGAILNLAGPGKKISGVLPCTVIRPGDMADQILDNEKNPEWQGERMKMVYKFPDNEKLWMEDYATILNDGHRRGDGLEYANRFYENNREEMDRGSIVAWKERYNHDEISAIQSAMNLRIRNEIAFWSEYQNEPLSEGALGVDALDAETISEKFNGNPRRVVPLNTDYLTMFIDVQKRLLYYVIVAWKEDFTGYVVDYGTYPDQARDYFTLKDARITMESKVPGAGVEASIYSALTTLEAEIMKKDFIREDGIEVRLNRILIDANWSVSTDVVYQFCKQSDLAAILLPSHGVGVTASSQPFSAHKRKAGERIGHNWRLPSTLGKRMIRHIVYDTNYWKSFVYSRLAVALGDKGGLTFFGKDSKIHLLFSHHLTAEYRIVTEGRGRTVEEWKENPEHRDNHWFDCLVGATVAANMEGAKTVGVQSKPKAARKGKTSFAAMQRNRKLGK